jgi:hypothetical protein
MCSSPSVPKAAPPQEPMKQAATRSAEASDAAAREAALRRGLASTFTRFDAPADAGSKTIGG